MRSVNGMSEEEHEVECKIVHRRDFGSKVGQVLRDECRS